MLGLSGFAVIEYVADAGADSHNCVLIAIALYGYTPAAVTVGVYELPVPTSTPKSFSQRIVVPVAVNASAAPPSHIVALVVVGAEGKACIVTVVVAFVPSQPSV